MKMKTAKRMTALILASLLLAACSRTEPAAGGEETDPVSEPAVTTADPGTGKIEAEPAGNEGPAANPDENGDEKNEKDEKTDPVPAAPVSKSVSIVIPATYSEVFKKLNTRTANRGYGRYAMADGMAEEDAVEAEAPMMPAPEPTAAADTAVNMVAEKAAYADDSVDFSETNTQVKGIDEADIVKTDGTYIYALFNGELRIYTAAGADTALLSRTKAADSERYYEDEWNWAKVEGEKSDYSYNSWKNAEEMFILGDTAVVIANCGENANGQVDGEWRYEDKSYVLADFYDISDRANPVLVSSAGQDGYYQSSRLMDGKLYLITNKYNYGWYGYKIDESMPREYVPILYTDGDAEPVAVDRICWPETTEESSYTVVGRYDVAGRAMEDSLSVLGAGNTFYMSKNYLYLADSRYFNDLTNEFNESIYRVEEYASGDRTELLKLSVTGPMEIVATGTVDGDLLNQFSMDEYNGYLRVVTTSWNNAYQIWNDDEREFSNWKYLESGQTNGLYIFDESMNLTGSVASLAPDERVYSVRFDGEVGYFVTFRQVDPLFAVNLSDPANPTVMSALKIPGFSRYMHPWSEGLLFGLGQDADEETGRTGGMKLSMFVTSDPYAVYEKDKLILDESYSEALYNHKALLIAPQKGVIGFPADNGYVLYHYDEQTGFTKTNQVDLDDKWYWSWNTRGLYVGDIIYIVAEQGVTVLNLITGDFITTIYN
jgi:uncharacterized secreted protein with C-terminal beta-propeller domain